MSIQPHPSSRSRSPVASIALIGVGGFGGYHLRCLRSLEKEGVARLVAVADPNPAQHGNLHAELTSAGVRWHLDFRALLELEREVDLVIIATPIHLHESMVRAALDLTESAIFLEKPPAPTLDQLHSLIEADPRQRVHVGFQMVAYPATRRLLQWIREGRLGRVRRISGGAVWPRGDDYYGRSSWAGRLITDEGQPVFDGPATNALAHLAHNIMVLGESEAGRYSRPAEIHGEFYRARGIQSYDAACMTGRLESGIEYALAVAHCSRELLTYVVRVEGDEGEAEITNNGSSVRASFAPPEDFGEPQTPDFHRETILRVLSGERPLTALGDCVGYSELTCGALISSGGIHDIPADCIDAGASDPERIIHVDGMVEAVAHTIKDGRSWSAQGVAWRSAAAETLSSQALAARPFCIERFAARNGR